MNTDEIGMSLLAASVRVLDVSSRHRRRNLLPALLMLAPAAMLVSACSLYAIVQ